MSRYARITSTINYITFCLRTYGGLNGRPARGRPPERFACWTLGFDKHSTLLMLLHVKGMDGRKCGTEPMFYGRTHICRSSRDSRRSAVAPNLLVNNAKDSQFWQRSLTDGCKEPPTPGLLLQFTSLSVAARVDMR
ncbi:hypothetical protein J6590_026995 [Homalodisca vitripennis]|nr:hypothetical protein J6590_026995 [Homalodisca vitripennis]